MKRDVSEGLKEVRFPKCRLVVLDPDMLTYDPRSALRSAFVSSGIENSDGGTRSIAYGVCYEPVSGKMEAEMLSKDFSKPGRNEGQIRKGQGLRETGSSFSYIIVKPRNACSHNTTWRGLQTWGFLYFVIFTSCPSPCMTIELVSKVE